MWFEYVKEREGKDIEKTEDGFVIYQISNDILFIQDIYVKPEKRRSNIAKKLADSVVDKAKEAGCIKLYCNCDLKALNWRDSIKFIYSYGCEFKKMETESVMLLVKDI